MLKDNLVIDAIVEAYAAHQPHHRETVREVAIYKLADKITQAVKSEAPRELTEVVVWHASVNEIGKVNVSDFRRRGGKMSRPLENRPP